MKAKAKMRPARNLRAIAESPHTKTIWSGGNDLGIGDFKSEYYELVRSVKGIVILRIWGGAMTRWSVSLSDGSWAGCWHFAEPTDQQRVAILVGGAQAIRDMHDADELATKRA